MDAPRDTAERRRQAAPEDGRRGASAGRRGAADARRSPDADHHPAPPAPPPAGERQRHGFRHADGGTHGSHHGADRFAWRRRIRADPRRYRIYRVCVAVVGVTMMTLSVLLGWLPGPGGLPLFLLGLAVLASEFHWARRMLDRARAIAHRVHMWSNRQPVWVRWVSGLATVAALLALAWLGLRLVGGSDALPGPMGALVRGVPGLE